MQDYARVTFDLDADFADLFGWNTKQIFLSLAAEYPSRAHVRAGPPLPFRSAAYSAPAFLLPYVTDSWLLHHYHELQAHNQVVVWDRIVRRKQDAHVMLDEAVNKYGFREVSRSFA